MDDLLVSLLVLGALPSIAGLVWWTAVPRRVWVASRLLLACGVLAGAGGATACPEGVDPRACAEHAACLVRVYVAAPAEDGVTEAEAALTSRLRAEHACGLEGWGYAVTSSAARRLERPVPSPVPLLCPPPLSAEAPICAERPLWIDLLSHGGACALCGGGVALGAWAAQRVTP